MVEFVAIAILVAGIRLLQRGRWPARVGNTPHCPGCSYILTGIQSHRCPECARDISKRNVIRGERHRRPGLTVLGLLFVLLSIAIVSGDFAGLLPHVEWYHYRPTPWVMRDLDAPLPALRCKALTELQRRLAGNSLSAAQSDALIERALREQRPGGAGNCRYDLVGFLGQQYLDHGLDDAGARIVESTKYPGTNHGIRLATQSGPLLVLDGQINTRFTPSSANRRLRSGVGVSSAQRVHFVISGERVTFYELASLFRDRLSCREALYLDGVISRFYVPGRAPEASDGDFAGIFAVVTTR